MPDIDSCGAMLFVVIGFCIIGTFLLMRINTKMSFRRLAKQLARRSGGRLEARKWYESPAVVFQHRGAEVRLDSCMYIHAGKFTRLVMQWPASDFRCEIFNRGYARGGNYLGMRDVPIGSPTFDQEYVVTSNQPGRLQSFVTPQMQTLIVELHKLRESPAIYFSICGGRLEIKRQGELYEYDVLAQFFRLGMALYDAAWVAFHPKDQMRGIEFIAAEESPEEVWCQICGEPINSNRVLCRQCHTPHHNDCWEYFGQCSTFGCGGKQCVGETTARAQQPK